MRKSPLISRMAIFKSLLVHFFEKFPNNNPCSSAFVNVDSLERNWSRSYNVNLLFEALFIESEDSKKLEIVSATSPRITI